MFEPIFTRLRNNLLFLLEQVLIFTSSGLQLIFVQQRGVQRLSVCYWDFWTSHGTPWPNWRSLRWKAIWFGRDKTAGWGVDPKEKSKT